MMLTDHPPDGRTTAPGHSETVAHIAQAAADLAAMASLIQAPLLVHLLSMAALEAKDMQKDAPSSGSFEGAPP